MAERGSGRDRDRGLDGRRRGREVHRRLHGLQARGGRPHARGRGRGRRDRRDRQRRLPGLRAHGPHPRIGATASPRRRAAARPRARPRSPPPRRSGGCSSPTRSPSPWPSSPRPRPARSTDRRSSSTEEGSRHDPVSGLAPASPRAGSTSTSPSTTAWRRSRFNRPEKLNALTFDAYADLRDLLAELPHRGDARVLVLTGEGRGFCSGGDVEEIIGELQQMETAELLEFTRMTGAVVKALRECPLPVIAADQRRRRRRRLGDRAGQRLPAAGARRRRSRSSSRASGCPAPTWGRPTCCRGSSGWAARRSC